MPPCFWATDGPAARLGPHSFPPSVSFYPLARARSSACRRLVGDLAAAEHYVRMLLDHSTRHALPLWRAWSRCHQGVLVIRRGDLVSGLQLLRAGLDELGEATSALRFPTFLGEMAEALGHAG